MTYEAHCGVCGGKFVNMEHPLKPGVIMLRTCQCEIALRTDVGAIQEVREERDPHLEIVRLRAALEDVRVIAFQHECECRTMDGPCPCFRTAIEWIEAALKA